MKTLQKHIEEKLVINKNIQNIEEYFIYKINRKDRIAVIDNRWPQFKDYKDKIYVNGEHVELDNEGWTNYEYTEGTYKIEIKDLDNITNCLNMFRECFQLIKVPWFNTSKVKNMEMMFYECDNILEVPLFDTSNVTNMYKMFADCSYIKSVPKFDTKNCKDFREMFNACNRLETVPLFDMSKMENINFMFWECDNLSNKTISQWLKIYDFITHNKIK